jgi:mono/diheme cytochrome c family protein
MVMRRHLSSKPACCLVAVAALAVGAPPCPAQKAKPVDFAHDVVPIIRSRCAECHTNGKYKGSLSMDTRADLLKSKAVVPGKAAVSELIKRVSSDKPDHQMPPKGDRLTPKQVKLLEAWIDQGLPWESGYSFKGRTYVPPLEPRRVKPPPAVGGRDHPIDRILDAYYAKNKLEPPEALGDAAFLRRVYLDLVGQLPTPAELEAFLKDAAKDKRSAAVKRLLDDPRPYAEHWLTFWNDLLRNDYAGTGYIDGGRKQISAWLYRSLIDNKPYDQFARELISPSAESEGFIRGIKWRGNVNASQVVELQFSQNVSQVFFGINMKCASCHDSFIDTWKLEDAYGLAAVIADAPLEIHRCDKPTGRKATPGFVFPRLGTLDARATKAKRLEQLAKLVTHEKNGRFTRTMANRLWQRFMGRGIVHPVDVMANPPFDADLLDYLGTYLSDNKYDLKKLMAHVVTSRAYQSKPAVRKEEAGEAYVFRGPELKRLTAEQFLDAIWQVTATGPQKHAAPVKPPAWTDATPAERRSVRASLLTADALMRSLGRPNREQVVTTRPDQLTTLQAIDLANGKALAELLTRGAAALRKAHPKATAAELTETVYVRALCRKPTDGEVKVAGEIIGEKMTDEGVADLLWAVFMLPEFQLVR